MPFLDLTFTQSPNLTTLLDANSRIEQVEVLLRNLMALSHPEEECFVIPFDDVKVTLILAISLLAGNQQPLT